MSVLLVSVTVGAQAQTDSTAAARLDSSIAAKYRLLAARLGIDSFPKGMLWKYRHIILSEEFRDTTGRAKLMQDYGMRNYDTRIGRYIPPDPNQSAIANPYAYPKKLPVKRAKKK